VTTELMEAPAHPFANGVIVYVAVPFPEVAVVVKICEMIEPLPAEAPLKLDDVAVQLNVVPPIPLGLVIGIEVACPDKIFWVTGAETLGKGFTVTTGTVVEPVHPFAVGVMV
jgi:hypothetical protein